MLYASKYDAFVLEEDGRIDEQMFNEYTSLNLRYTPRFTLVSSEEEANALLKERSFELIISMPSGDNINPFEWAKQVKKEFQDIPIVLLTPFSKSVSKRLANEDLSAIDYVFSWLGNSDLLLAIIKLIEDRMNVDEDVNSVGVQVILFVEDSIHFIEKVNKQLTNENRHYVLVGPGRWGSADPWLGIPVKWPHISKAQVIVESGLSNYRIDPSQGTHFF